MSVKAKPLFEVSEIGGAWVLTIPDKALSESFPMDERSGGDKRLAYQLFKYLGIHRRLDITPFQKD